MAVKQPSNGRRIEVESYKLYPLHKYSHSATHGHPLSTYATSTFELLSPNYTYKLFPGPTIDCTIIGDLKITRGLLCSALCILCPYRAKKALSDHARLTSVCLLLDSTTRSDLR